MGSNSHPRDLASATEDPQLGNREELGVNAPFVSISGSCGRSTITVDVTSISTRAERLKASTKLISDHVFLPLQCLISCEDGPISRFEESSILEY
jgi:hypothetical protein